MLMEVVGHKVIQHPQTHPHQACVHRNYWNMTVESFLNSIFTQYRLTKVSNIIFSCSQALIIIISFIDAPQREIYFLAVIDVLTHYGVKKQAAKAAKTVKYGSNVEGISTCEPDQYAKRFIEFISKVIE